MFALMQLFVALVSNRFKSPRRLEIENLYLRHQLNIALRQTRHRFRLKGADRALLVWMTWLWPSMLSLSRVVQPDTILRWHRAGFRAYWRWKSRRRSGRPGIARELREVIRQMSRPPFKTDEMPLQAPPPWSPPRDRRLGRGALHRAVV